MADTDSCFLALVRYTGHLFANDGVNLNKILTFSLLIVLSGCDSDPIKLNSAGGEPPANEGLQTIPSAPTADQVMQAPEPLNKVRTMPLDLSIPEQNNDHLLDGEDLSTDLLPDLFSGVEKAGPEAGRTSFGGRLVLDEETEEYSMESVRGAELTVEVLTP